MLTVKEQEAKEVFEQALVEAWRVFDKAEHEAMLVRQETMLKAHEEFVKAVGKPACMITGCRG